MGGGGIFGRLWEMFGRIGGIILGETQLGSGIKHPDKKRAQKLSIHFPLNFLIVMYVQSEHEIDIHTLTAHQMFDYCIS